MFGSHRSLLARHIGPLLGYLFVFFLFACLLLLLRFVLFCLFVCLFFCFLFGGGGGVFVCL